MLALIAPFILAAAIPAAPAAAPLRVEVPQDRGPQEAVVLERVFAIGQGSGWHVHDGIEIGRVVSGETEMRTPGGTVRYRAGETFMIPRGLVHQGFNAGNEPAVLALTYLIDRGAPLRRDAPAPR
jgi:quercetin dioxygenase-like cupin family protein